MKNNRIDVIIPTYKPGKEFISVIEKLQSQSVVPDKIILMNTDEALFSFIEESQIIARYDNIEVHHIKKEEFDHGRTRHKGVQYSQAPFFLCMTQDAVPADNRMIEKLLEALDENKVAAAYGRQLPREDSTILERYTRSFNYPDQDRIKSAGDMEELGIKTFFCSNVCAAYNRLIYDKAGGFIQRTIFNEDMIYAAGIIRKGYRIAYCAGAKVIHSHNYTGKEQFQRNFDLGVSQADHPDIFANVPSEKEGKKMVKKILRMLLKRGHFFQTVAFVYQSGCKLLGYRLGKAYKRLPKPLIRAFTMNENYWRS